MTLAAVFFPADPEASAFDLLDEARAGLTAGMRLYSNGRQFALLPKPMPGWSLFGTGVRHPQKETQPCVH